MENKNMMFKKYMNAKSPTRKEHFCTQYKTQKNEITTLTRQSKKDYYNQYTLLKTQTICKKSGKLLKKLLILKLKTWIIQHALKKMTNQ